MIRVAIELWPFGNESKSKVIDEIFIANMGDAPNPETNGTWCVYNVWLERPTKETYYKSVSVVEHRREDGAKELLRKVMNELAKDADETK